jgi:hypothetical protein
MGCVNTSPPDCPLVSQCPDKLGCPPGVCPDFQIKRHDTRPSFKYNIVNDDGDPMDLTGLVVEASMWANAKLKSAIDSVTTTIQFADNIGFEQVLVDDIIVMDRVRDPEYMKITAFDEINYTITVERGYNSTPVSSWKKGAKLKIFRFKDAAAATEMVTDDVLQVDGTTLCDQLIESYLVYEWTANDTCVPGCFWLEFKLIQMATDPVDPPSVTPVCWSGLGVEWVRRYPQCGEFLIAICDSPTAEAN